MYRPLLFLCATVLPICLAGTSPKKVIIDVDAGTDDYQALVALLNAESRKEIKILAIVCSDGNTKLKFVLKNVIRLLKAVGRLEIPIYAGSFSSILPREQLENFYGLDGFGSLKLKEDLTKPDLIRAQLAPTAISELVKANPKQIIYVALGPLTNLALALRMDDFVHANLKEIFIMGGNFDASIAEFNFLGDPEAAHIVLDTAKCPMTLLPFQACQDETLTNGWFFNLSIPSNPVWDLNHMAERAMFVNEPPTNLYVRCDPILAEAFLRPTLMIKKAGKYLAKVELSGKGRGKVIIDPRSKQTNIVMIEKANIENFKSLYVQEFTSICQYNKCGKYYN